MKKPMNHALNPTTPFILSGEPLSIDDVARVARDHVAVELAPTVRPIVDRARAAVESIASGNEPVYGINTGFGSLSRVRIDHDGLHDLQRNIVRSHAACVGEPLPKPVVRAMMLILAASLARGHSGVRLELIERLVVMLNDDCVPVIPSRGSVGASGDLAPLAHLALGLIGEGDLHDSKSVEPLMLESKEGLALINGTHMMCAIGALAIADIDRILAAATVSTAMAFDACRACHAPLDQRLHAVRNQPGQIAVATRLRDLLAGSEIVEAHRENDPRVQDPYSLRAAPQVLGAAVDSINHVRGTIEAELGAVTDNPLVFGEAIVSGGNFHGMPLAISLDTLRIALCHVAGIAERRVFWVLSGTDTVNPVTPYLASDPGLHSGLMVAQYTAAALCNELGVLAHPASPGNISTSAGIEDYNSMGATAALLAMQAVELVRNVIAIELLTMTQAFEHQRPLKSGAGVEAAYETVRQEVAPFTEDRTPSPCIAKVAAMIEAGLIG
jgi:histidine ammonia-lyase